MAVILSAQCTDKRINQVTPALFDALPTPQALAEATPEAVLEYIRSVSYPNNKARHLVGMARMLVERYGGEVPALGEELEKLPGVGRKTANVIQAVVFQKARMAVDTHVFRVSHRIGLVPPSCTTPLSVEKQLTAHFPASITPPTSSPSPTTGSSSTDAMCARPATPGAANADCSVCASRSCDTDKMNHIFNFVRNNFVYTDKNTYLCDGKQE